MSQAYEEILEGETLVRSAPGPRHETICQRLHERVTASLQNNVATKILAARSIIQISPGTMVRPDLALVTAATGKAWLVAEIVDSRDHRADTVLKKQIYEDLNLPRLWMIDPRYDNVEIYHGTPHGLALQKILAGRELVRESLLPQLALTVNELFGVT
jgi:Uma2 family endonuclease